MGAPSFLALLLLTSTGVETIPARIAWVSEGQYCEPETVLALPDDSLLVSNVCDFRTEGTGFLTLLGGDGQVIDWRAVDGLDAPLGMALVGDRLYLVDANRIRVFGWPGFAPLEQIQLETQVANDIAVAPDGVVYVTDTALGQVVRLDGDRQQSILKTEFPGANGIALHGDRLYVGGSALWIVDLESGSVTTIGPDSLTDIDGIEVEPDGTLQVTPVAGPLWRGDGQGEWVIHADERLSSANHGYAPRLGLALIPTGFDNTVVAVEIGAEQ